MLGSYFKLEHNASFQSLSNSLKNHSITRHYVVWETSSVVRLSTNETNAYIIPPLYNSLNSEIKITEIVHSGISVAQEILRSFVVLKQALQCPFLCLMIVFEKAYFKYWESIESLKPYWCHSHRRRLHRCNVVIITNGSEIRPKKTWWSSTTRFLYKISWKYFWRRVQIMELLTLQSFPVCCRFILLWSTYSPKHPVLRHPQSVSFP
jgi:hypothetical protein